MVDDLKNRGDRILKNILQSFAGSDDDGAGTRDLVLGLLSKAGRSKDEVIQILGKEIGFALAAVLAKPLEQMTENKRIRITVELVPKAKTTKKRAKKTSTSSKS
jgi:hypothetical protein